jgi:hypothetical protein
MSIGMLRTVACIGLPVNVVLNVPRAPCPLLVAKTTGCAHRLLVGGLLLCAGPRCSNANFVYDCWLS